RVRHHLYNVVKEGRWHDSMLRRALSRPITRPDVVRRSHARYKGGPGVQLRPVAQLGMPGGSPAPVPGSPPSACASAPFPRRPRPGPPGPASPSLGTVRTVRVLTNPE